MSHPSGRGHGSRLTIREWGDGNAIYFWPPPEDLMCQCGPKKLAQIKILYNFYVWTNTFFGFPTHFYIEEFENKIFIDTLLLNICSLFLRHILCQIRSLLFLSPSVEKLPNVFPLPPNTWFPAVSEILFSTILVTIAILDSHKTLYLPTTTRSSHTCHSTIIVSAPIHKVSKETFWWCFTMCIHNLIMQVERDEWIGCVGIFWLSAAPVCQVVLACFVNLSQKAAAKKVTNNQVYLPTPQR